MYGRTCYIHLTGEMARKGPYRFGMYLEEVTQNINNMARSIGDRWAFELGFGGSKGPYIPAGFVAQEVYIYTCIYNSLSPT